MADLYLMERKGEQMNVPAEKLESFKAEGWVVLKTPEQNRNVVVVDQPLVEPPEVVPAKKTGRKG